MTTTGLHTRFGSTVLPLLLAASNVWADTPVSTRPAPRDGLNAARRKQVAEAVDRGLAWIAKQQQPGGAFPTETTGQPAITSLCVLAYLSRGHLPGKGPYGQRIDAAIDYTLSWQKPSGLMSYEPASYETRNDAGFAAGYNHAISSLMLCEVLRMTTPDRADRIRAVVKRALPVSYKDQKLDKEIDADRGGWRYIIRPRPERGYRSDLSVTSWQLLFLRSARKAGFDVPAEVLTNGIEYVQRCFDHQAGTFLYGLTVGNRVHTRGMAGAGIVSLALADMRDCEPARRAAHWLLKHPFDEYNVHVGSKEDRFHYGAFHCSHAVFQLGGRYSEQFYPVLVKTMPDDQRTDGSWEPEDGEDERYGNICTTALTVLALNAPSQHLKVFQR